MSALQPEWIALTVSVTVAVWTIFNGMIQHQRNLESDRRAQAEGVSVWLDSPPLSDTTSTAHVVIHNGSRHAISDVTVVFKGSRSVPYEHPPEEVMSVIDTEHLERVLPHWGSAYQLGVIPPHDSPKDALRIPVGHNRAAAIEAWNLDRQKDLGSDREGAPEPAHLREFHIELHFVDNAGRPWRRYDGQLRLMRKKPFDPTQPPVFTKWDQLYAMPPKRRRLTRRLPGRITRRRPRSTEQP